MRVMLDRDRNNEFSLPESFLMKTRVRIVGVYENEQILTSKDYHFMGPRRIKILRPVPKDSKIYGKIVEINVGNKIAAR